MNIFYLAYKQLEREGKLNKLPASKEFNLMISRAKKIRAWLDIKDEARAKSWFKSTKA